MLTIVVSCALIMSAIKEVAQVCDGQTARALLGADPQPGLVREVACRADELGFDDSEKALEVAAAALEAQEALPVALRCPRLEALTWWVLGSCCRALVRFDEAELAFSRAAGVLPSSDVRGHAEVARRLADLRADQRRGPEAVELMAEALAYWRGIGGRELGKRLCTSGSILIRLHAYREAAADLEESLTLLPANGDRFHLSAVFNLAVCRLELSSSRTELKAAECLVAEAASLLEPGTLAEIRWHWLAGKLLWRMGRLDSGLAELETARAGIDQRSTGFDRALLLLDLTDLHLERGEPATAHHVALSSYAVMAALRNEPEALRAIEALHRAAQALSIDRATVSSVRRALIASQP